MLTEFKSPLLLFAVLLTACATYANRAKASNRPNVVMILADDQSYRDFGFMGNDLVHTPNIDRLAAQSARYPNGYVSMSVCRPSLATLLTGLYPHQHGIHFLLPAILSAVGLPHEASPRMGGIDLMPSAIGEKPLENRPVFGAIYPNDAQVLGSPSLHVRGKWVRHGDFKLLVPGPAKSPLPLGLFNLRSDLDERNNLVSSQNHAEKITRVRQLLEAGWPQADDNLVT